MKRIAVLYGMEETFPPALVDRINSIDPGRVSAEHLKVGAVSLGQPPGYDVIIDRISHDIPFYRAYLKHAVLEGATVINNPFWWSADDKFFNYALAKKLGVAVPPTVLLPHHEHPPGTTSRSMRNLIYPLTGKRCSSMSAFRRFSSRSWAAAGGTSIRWTRPTHFLPPTVRQPTCACACSAASTSTEYFRCYVVGQEQVHIMPYDPLQPHERRYAVSPREPDAALHDRMVKDALTLCRALGYDLNTVEFAVEAGIPYAIDFMNPAPDADLHSVGQDNFGGSSRRSRRWLSGRR